MATPDHPAVGSPQPPEGVRGRGRALRAVVIGWLLLVLLAALYEGAIALGLVDLGRLPGDEPPGRATLLALAHAALLGGGLALVVVGLGGLARGASDGWSGAGVRLSEMPELGLVPLIAAALFIAHYFSYDAYYAPSLRRFSTGLPVGMVVVVACWAALVAIGLRLRRVSGPAAIAASLLLLVIWSGMIVGGAH